MIGTDGEIQWLLSFFQKFFQLPTIVLIYVGEKKELLSPHSW